jgi:endonuclease/exonuclease/phosphatase family metal-dependent hydrolase
MKRRRLFLRRAVACASLGVLTLGSSFCSRAEGQASRIVIDGSFEDWKDVPIAVRDPADPAAVLCDFREVRATSDSGSVFFSVRLQHRLLLRISGGTIGVLFDADGDPATGWSEHGMKGVDLVIQGHPGDADLVEEGNPVGLRIAPLGSTQPVWSEARSLTSAGMMRAPAYESDRFEVRVQRAVPLPSHSEPLLTGRHARVKLVAVLADGTLVDETKPVSLDLAAYRPAQKVDDDADPLFRWPKTKLRVLEWNVSHRTLAEREDQIVRILSALRPDLLLLNEVSDRYPEEELVRVLDPPHVLGASGPLQVVYGHGGGEERAVIAGRFPLRTLPTLSDLKYPMIDLGAVLGADRVSPQLVTQLAEGVQVAGVVATIADLRVLVTSLGLKAGGHSSFEIEEFLRLLQTRSIASAMAGARSEAEFDAVIVAGDFNLVVTERPLTTIQRDTQTWGAPLSIVNAVQLDGLSAETWSNPDVLFAPGRLDFMLYSAPALELERAFVFDSRDLAPRWLKHHALYEEISAEASDHFPIVADFSW